MAKLWVTDGTAAGTLLLKDILPGRGSSSIQPIGSNDGFFYFSASDPDHGRELWVTDGTATGTRLVRDIALPTAAKPSVIFDSNVPAVQLGEKMIFAAFSDGVGSELWISDGTAAGTSLLKDIHPGVASANASLLTVLGEKVFFRATDGANGVELWVTDGTSAGTVMVKNIRSGLFDSAPQNFAVLGVRLIFTAFEETTGSELWASDGTEAGTVRGAHGRRGRR